MKRSFVILWAAAALLLSACDVKSRSVTIAIDDSQGDERQAIARRVIEQRISSHWQVKEIGELTGGRFTVAYSGSADDSLLTQMLSQRGEVVVTETYQAGEIESELREAFGTTAPFTSDLYGPVVLGSLNEDRAEVDSLLAHHSGLFPADLSFHWVEKRDADHNLYFELIAVKNNGRGFPLNPESVERCGIAQADYGYNMLSIELREPYAEAWAHLTRENIGRSLAFLLDDQVIMFPRVNAEITGGRLSITGTLSDDELSLLRSFILGGVLDCPARIVENKL